jgi:hypothetical protein
MMYSWVNLFFHSGLHPDKCCVSWVSHYTKSLFICFCFVINCNTFINLYGISSVYNLYMSCIQLKC